MAQFKVTFETRKREVVVEASSHEEAEALFEDGNWDATVLSVEAIDPPQTMLRELDRLTKQ